MFSVRIASRKILVFPYSNPHFLHLCLPKTEREAVQPLELEEWERLLLTCRPSGETTVLTERAMVRNQTLLWVLAESGLRISAVCGLHLSDWDRACGILTIQEKGSTRRQLSLGQEGLRALLSYLDQYRPEVAEYGDRIERCEEPLFLSETGRSLTDNGISLLFGRLRKRAGITRKGVSPALLRESFAV